jgi:tetratricopeptide (TPR) repeat protein
MACWLMSMTQAGAHESRPNLKHPFSGLWRSPVGSIVNIKNNYGVLIYTHSGPWKGYLNKITIKNIRRQEGKWFADEWVTTSEKNIWLVAEWKRVGNRIKRSMNFKGEKLETYFVKTKEDFFSLGADPEAYYQRGTDYRRLGRYREAISDYNRAIALNPAYVAAYYNRGMAAQDLGEFDQALSDFGKVIQLDPSAAAAYCHRGMIYFIRGAYGQALKDFKQAQSLGGQIHPKLFELLEAAAGGDR